VNAPAVENIAVGVNLNFTVTATDSEAITSLTASGMPSGATFTPNGTNTSGTFSWTPATSDTGNYDVVFTASNSMSGSATTHLHVTPLACGFPPVLSAPSSRTVTEGQMLTFAVTATDADGDHVTLTTGTLPSGATATDNGNNTLAFAWTPSTSQAGTYTVEFRANDDHCGTVTATTTITVNDSGGGGNCPVLTAPSSRTVTEGQTVSFTVSSTAPNGLVTLTTGTLPSGATATDNGNNTLSFSWMPGTGQAGTYNVEFRANDGTCSTVTATTTITVLQSGGGGGTPEATVTLIGIINTHNDRTCFRIKAVNNSFDLKDVDLSTLSFRFDGQTLSPVRAQLQTDCDEEGDDGGSCDDNDAPRALLGHGHGDQGGDDDCGDCNDDCGSDCNPDNCDVTAIRVCFSTGQLLGLFNGSVQDSLNNATIQFTLNDGTVVVASFEGTLVKHGNGNGAHFMAKAKPNPLNPRTTLTFTLSKPGRVQVSVYDLQGRLVKKLLDQSLAAGAQSLDWDGSNAHSSRVSSGVYFFRIQAPEGHTVERVAVVK
jgi:hypothetical protein